MFNAHTFIKRILPKTGWQWLVVIALVWAAFSRLYLLSESALFIGDQGRDALIVSRIFTAHDMVFIGPVTSVGNMYLGPFYYYFMLPFLFVTYPSPVGPAYGVAILGIVFVFFVYYWGRELVGERAAAIASVLAATSAVVVNHSRFSWNPNIAPLVALFLAVALYRAVKGKRWYWVAAAAAASILLQLHYVTLLACGVAGLLWIYHSICQFRVGKGRSIILPTVLAAAVVLMSFSPLILFDMKHNALNRNALYQLITADKNFSGASSELLTNDVYRDRVVERAEQILVAIYTVEVHEALAYLPAVAVVLAIVFLIWGRKHTYYTSILQLLLFVSIGILGTSLYKNAVYDHYILYTVPFVVLLWGAVAGEVWKKSWGPGVVLAILITISAVNAKEYSFAQHGTPYPILEETAAAIHERTKEDEEYAIVLLTPSKDLYGMNFRYFLSIDPDTAPVSPEFTANAKKLFIIDEEKATDKPQDLPIYEIVTFPSKEVVEVFQIRNGPDVYVLENPQSSTSE